MAFVVNTGRLLTSAEAGGNVFQEPGTSLDETSAGNPPMEPEEGICI